MASNSISIIFLANQNFPEKKITLKFNRHKFPSQFYGFIIVVEKKLHAVIQVFREKLRFAEINNENRIGRHFGNS